jgi:serine/threonine-protein kinase
MEDFLGKTIDNYKILSTLGKGGMGIVYKAYDTKLDRFVAIKMLNSRVIGKPKTIERFKREAKNQAKLSHPNIVTVYGFIEYSNFLGIVMEYVEGESLEKFLDRQKRLHLYDVVYILKQVLLAIGYAHAKGYIHRDLKPSNIILNQEGIAKIMDFGISKSLFDEKEFTRTGAKIGTVYYMSPEQIRGEDVTHHTDIYSIGCTVYEMLTGRPPFYSESEYKVMDGHLKEQLPAISKRLPDIPPLVDKILFTSMKKNPNDRYDTCEEFYNALQELDKYFREAETIQFNKKIKHQKKIKTYSVLAFSGFVILFIGIVYFAYSQVKSLLESKYLESFKKYSIQSLFEPGEDSLEFTAIESVPSGTYQSLNSVILYNSRDMVAAGDSGTVLISNDSGKTWNNIDLNTRVNFHAGYAFSSGRTFIVGDSSTIIFSDNYFRSYKKLKLSGSYSLFDINFVNNSTGFIIGNKGLILRSTDRGDTWNLIDSPTKEILYDFAFLNQNDGYIVGWNGVILKTVNSGLTWSVTAPFTNKYLRSINFEDEDSGIIVGGGVIYNTDNGGESWHPVDIKKIGGLQNVKFISDEFALAVGNKGTILFTNDSGEYWRQIENNSYVNLRNLAIDENQKIFIVGVNGTILKIF